MSLPDSTWFDLTDERQRELLEAEFPGLRLLGSDPDWEPDPPANTTVLPLPEPEDDSGFQA